MFSSEVTEVLVKQLLSFFKTMVEKEFRVLLKYCFLMGKNTVEASSGLIRVMGTAPGKTTIIDWYAEFKRALVAQNQQLFRKT